MAEFKRTETYKRRGLLNRGDRVTTSTYKRTVDDETGAVKTETENKTEYVPDKD